MALQLLVISGSPSGGPRPNRSGGEKERLMKRNLVKILLVLAVCSLPMIASAGVLDGQSGTRIVKKVVRRAELLEGHRHGFRRALD